MKLKELQDLIEKQNLEENKAISLSNYIRKMMLDIDTDMSYMRDDNGMPVGEEARAKFKEMFNKFADDVESMMMQYK